MSRVVEAGVIAIALWGSLAPAALAFQDVYIKDTPADTGVEPNPDSGPMWVSEDVWVRRTPDPGYRPFPFPEASPPWVPAPHQNPEYRDPKYSVPNFVYVRVRNRGTRASTGTEQLQLYWAKASSGLAWPASWVDSFAPVCGTNRLLGAEITKPRKNAATASPAERQALRDALIQAATNPAFTFLAGHSYWTKQQHVHRFSPEHSNPAFLPWHREFLNRFEILVQEADPRVKLMYWNWTTDPAPAVGTNLYTAAFMGNSGRGTGGTGMGAPLAPALNPHPSDTAAAVVRDLSPGAPPAQADATVLGRTDYISAVPHDDFSRGIERVPNHNSTHGYIGGNGDMSFPARSTRDPFFFLLHGKVDELWARWQRANPSRFDSATAYGSAAGNPVLTSPQHPWDGVPNAGPPIDPWTAGGGYIVSKTSFDRSVVSPPIYDTAPLTIPALAPGQAVILEIPWYPPNPAHYACLGDMRHFCLLARITPGITTPEVSDVSANVRNNNNIAWKNIEVVDDFPGAMAAFSFFVRNDTERPMAARLLFREATDRFVTLSDQVAAVHVGLPPDLQRRWEEGGSRQQGLKPAELNLEPLRNVNPEIAKSRLLTLGGGAGMLDNLRLRPGEGYPVHLVFQLKPDYVPSRDVMVFDVVQRQVVGERTEIVGGVQYRLDLSRIELVKERGHWRFPADDTAPPEGWYGLNFDDSKWREGPAPFGFGRDQELTAGVPLGAEKGRTAYFRKRFQVGDRAFLRDLTLRARYDDGIVVYLNGREVHRANLPSGALTPTTPALKPVSGAAEKAFFTTKLKPDMLREGANVLAVEVRQHEPRGGDLVFDAELSANRADSAEAPSVSFLSVGQGALVKTGQELTVNLDAIAPDGHVRDVTLFANDRQVGALDRPPYDFKWMPSDGPQRLRAIAVDGEGRMSAEEVTVVGLKNVPPTVRMSVRQGDRARTLILSAEANDQDGKIREVEFFMAENDRFDAPWVSVGKKSEPPYEVTMPEPETHHRMVSVQATDDGGEVGVASTHIHGQGHR